MKRSAYGHLIKIFEKSKILILIDKQILTISAVINPLTTGIFTVFGQSLLEGRVLHKEAWVAKLLGTHLSIQVHKKVKFS